MGLDGLLGNERLKQNLSRSINRGHISHFYLISGPAGSGKHTLARLLSAAILCKSEKTPCLSCSACRKVLSGAHPDLITVTDPDHKNVAVKIVRQVREDMFIRPNEADRKIYVFPQELGIEGQNALLKILEEPPSYGVFLLLTDNPEKLLPTVRSRCTELALTSLPEAVLRRELENEFPQCDEDQIAGAIARSGGWLGQAKALLTEGNAVDPRTESFAEAFASRDAMGLLQVLVPMEKWKRDQLIPMLEQWLQLLQSALVSRSGMTAISRSAQTVSAARTSSELMEAIRHLQTAIEYAQGNVSVAAICGHLEWALR